MRRAIRRKSVAGQVDDAARCLGAPFLVEGEVVNRITVDPDTTEWAKVALQRMLEIV